MAAKAFDLEQYQHLLAEAHPALIESEGENQRVLNLIDALTRKKDRSAEEHKLLKLLVRLVEDFEEQHYALKPATVGQALQELLSAHNMTPCDVSGVFGSNENAAEVLADQRPISEDEASTLAELFHIPANLLLFPQSSTRDPRSPLP